MHMAHDGFAGSRSVTGAAKAQIRQARAGEEGIVAGVMGAAAANLAAKGHALWGPDEVSEAAVRAHVRAGMYHVAFDANQPLGVFRFQLEDRLFWPDIPEGTSAFVHKLAVCPGQQGRGVAQALLAHACGLALQQGRRFLRLDCMAGRPGLRRVYEQFGFRHHSDKGAGQAVVHRFELEVGNGPPTITLP